MGVICDYFIERVIYRLESDEIQNGKVYIVFDYRQMDNCEPYDYVVNYIKKINTTTKGHLLYSLEKSEFPLCMKVVNMSTQFSHRGKKS